MTIRWKPNATVASIMEHQGRYLFVEEETPQGLRINNPAGHMDCGETPFEACVRETLEETAHHFTPTALVGVYMSRQTQPAGTDVTYLRFAFCGEVGAFCPERSLDTGIVRTLWLTEDEIRASTARHRSGVVLQCMEDYWRGKRYPLELIQVFGSLQAPPK